LNGPRTEAFWISKLGLGLLEWTIFFCGGGPRKIGGGGGGCEWIIFFWSKGILMWCSPLILFPESKNWGGGGKLFWVSLMGLGANVGCSGFGGTLLNEGEGDGGALGKL
jgi:hypothetical protein